MNLRDLVDTLELCPVCLADGAESAAVSAAYCGDLLSDVLAHAPAQSVWFTIQSHVNIVAVAQLRDVACVVLVNGVAPHPETVAKARAQRVNVCASAATSADLCMRLAGKL